MSIVLLCLGIACLLVGSYSAFARERVVARLRARPNARDVPHPMAYLVMGTIVGLAGVGLVINGLR